MPLDCTQAERDALASAIKSGTSMVAYSDKTVKYASVDDMRKILAEMDAYLAGASAPPRHSRASFSRE